MMYFCRRKALVAKLVDAPDLGSGVARRVGSSPIRRTFLADFPFGAHRKGFLCIHGEAGEKRRTRFLPSGALPLVAPPYLSPLSGESTKHLPTFENSLGVFSLNSPTFARVHTRARQSISRKSLHPSPPYPILLIGRYVGVKAFASSPPSPTRATSSRSSPTFFEPSERPDNCSPKR